MVQRISKETFPCIYVTEASAGSGKTYTLAKRYVRLLINPSLAAQEIPLQTILAITFTNKAALEMKERILDFLKKIALDKFPTIEEKNEIIKFLGVSEDAVRKKVFLIMDVLLSNYQFFQVQTIDSFINAILSGCAFKLDLSAGFKTQTEYKEYLSYSLDKLIDKAGSDKDVLELFRGFLKQYLYIENKEGWFPKKDIALIIADLYSRSNKYHGKFLRSNIEIKDLLFCKNEALGLIEELAQNIPEGTDKRFADYLSDFSSDDKDSFDIAKLSNYFNREGFPLNKGYVLSSEIEVLWKKIRVKLKQLCELEALSKFNYYIDIFNRVLEDLKIKASKEDVLFLEELNKQARVLFDEKSLELPELYLRLATRFRHFLLDEFQDTSLLQWENLVTMIQEALSQAGSLFYVGDKKQAIYRFRGGEVSLIDTVKEQFKGYPVISDTLQRNFRSAREIVEFNNAVFSKENLTRFLTKDEIKKELSLLCIDEVLHIFKDAKQEGMRHKTGGYVKCEFIGNKNENERNSVLKEKFICQLEDLRKRFSAKDIGILTRTNLDVQLVTSWLLEKNIPVESEKTLNIRENAYIKELISFLKFLNSPIDNLSFASFISGSIFCKASGISQEKIRDFIFNVNNNSDNQVYLYRKFQLAFPDVWDNLLKDFFRSVGLVPLYEFVVTIYNKFSILGNFERYQGFFMRFLELVKEQEEKNPGISDFIAFFDSARDEDLFVNVTSDESVRVMTIHKSKGLEFSAVVIPFLEMDIKLNSDVVDVKDGTLRLLYIKQRFGDFSEGLNQILEREYLKSFIDELNSVYVALTRARDELYVYVSPRVGNKLNFASLLFENNKLEIGEKRNFLKEIKRKDLSNIEIPVCVYKDWIHLLQDEFIDENALIQREKILKGDVLHFVLSCIGNLYNQDGDLFIRNAFQKAKQRFLNFDDFPGCEKITRRLFSDKDFLEYFYLKDAKVYQEKEIVSRSGDTKRIDRLIIKKDEAVVIDYKSARMLGQDYQKQVKEYMELIKEIYPSLIVRGVLIYLDDLTIEEVEA
ncbi:MAG: UvrD-helicase domain-containing protein [Candidatus Omnitrophica bacterium]|nr:UvrD-helicase domain-containing protein [Candidatus Omnitrophota bacterium]